MITRIIAIVLTTLLLAACQEEPTSETPVAISMTEEALGHYCQMSLAEHEGPKAQIHLVGHLHPVWFSQVRDAIAFTRLPEETADVAAIYVSDMGQAKSWADPGIDNWVAADVAIYVIESRSRGGMGTPEAVPFADESAAKDFAVENGGRLVSLEQIPDDYVLGPVDVTVPPADELTSDDGATSAPVNKGAVTQ